LTCPAQAATAKRLFVSTEIRDTTDSTAYATANPYVQMYRPEISAYLGSASVAGSSQKTRDNLAAQFGVSHGTCPGPVRLRLAGRSPGRELAEDTIPAILRERDGRTLRKQLLGPPYGVE
jgi:hypothetical protein